MLSFLFAAAGLVSGKTSLADWCFLIAFILAVIATILFIINNPRTINLAFVSASLALIAFGFFVL